MLKAMVGLAAVMQLLLGSRVAAAQLSVAVSGAPSLAITTAVAGSNPTAVSDATSTCTITVRGLTKGATARLLGQLDANMPAGTTLSLTVAAYGTAVSAGAVNLDITPRNLLTGMPGTGPKGSVVGMTYQFSATAAAGVIASSTRTVTLTVVSP